MTWNDLQSPLCSMIDFIWDRYLPPILLSHTRCSQEGLFYIPDLLLVLHLKIKSIGFSVLTSSISVPVLVER